LHINASGYDRKEFVLHCTSIFSESFDQLLVWPYLPDVSKKKPFLAIFLTLFAHWIVSFRKEVKRDVKKNDEEAHVEVKETQMNR